MMERIIHPNDNAREAKATIWIFEGSSLYVLIASFALALAAFRYCYDGLGLGTWGSVTAGAAPAVQSPSADGALRTVCGADGGGSSDSVESAFLSIVPDSRGEVWRGL